MQVQVESIEDERTRSAVTYSMITAIQERCRLAEAPDGMTDNQLMTQAKKGRCSDWLNVSAVVLLADVSPVEFNVRFCSHVCVLYFVL